MIRNVLVATGLAAALVLAACGKKEEAAPVAPEAAPVMEAPAAEAAPAMEAPAEVPADEAAPTEAAPAEAAPAAEPTPAQ